MDSALKSEFVPLLRERGFKGSYPHLRRIGEKKVDIIGVQFSQWGEQFYLEIAVGPTEGITLATGKHIEPKKLKHYDTLERIRIGDNPYDYSEMEPIEVVKKVNERIDEIESWFENPNRQTFIKKPKSDQGGVINSESLRSST